MRTWPLWICLLVSSPALADTTLIFPHFADGAGYRTTFAITNLSPVNSTATLELILPNGSTMSSVRLVLASNGTVRASTGASRLNVGWARVSTMPPVEISGTATIQWFRGSALATEASVPPAPLDSNLKVLAIEKEGFRTGIAVANPGSAATNVTFTLRDSAGFERNARSLPLGPGQHFAQFVSELFSGLSDFEGSLEISSETAIATAVLRQHVSGILSSVPAASASTFTSGIFFSPRGGTANRIVEEIARARSTIDVAIYSFTRNEIADALISARNRGVSIRILTDTDQANATGAEAPRLEAAGFQLKRTKGGTPSGDMHNKYAIFDGRVVLTGSYNWSSRAENDSFENSIFIRHAATVAAYQANFNSIWNSR